MSETTKARLKEVLGFDDRIVMLICIPLVAFLVPLLFFKVSLSDGFTNIMPIFLVSIVYTSAYWFSVRGIVIYVRRRFPNYQDTQKRLLYTLGLVATAFLIICTVLEFIQISVEQIPTAQVSSFDAQVASGTVIALCTAIYESVFFYSRWRQSVIETERLRRENVESQLQGLRDQVNPHFLFNSLNTLTYIIPEDPERAVRFVQMLSKVYRYILEIKEKRLTTLEEELRFLDAYIFLLKERFDDSLRIELAVPPEVQAHRIVPLSLQMLFENAIKHNIIASDRPLTIEVFVENAALVIRNNLQRKKQVMASTRVGLQNIKNRYAFFSEKEVKVNVTETCFEVRLPLVESAKTATLAAQRVP